MACLARWSGFKQRWFYTSPTGGWCSESEPLPMFEVGGRPLRGPQDLEGPGCVGSLCGHMVCGFMDFMYIIYVLKCIKHNLNILCDACMYVCISEGRRGTS